MNTTQIFHYSALVVLRSDMNYVLARHYGLVESVEPLTARTDYENLIQEIKKTVASLYEQSGNRFNHTMLDINICSISRLQ